MVLRAGPGGIPGALSPWSPPSARSRDFLNLTCQSVVGQDVSLTQEAGESLWTWSLQGHSNLRVSEKVMELSSSSYIAGQGGETWSVSVLGPLLLFLPQLCRAILGVCILGAIMRCFSSHLAIFRQLWLAAWTRGQPSNLRAIVDWAGNREAQAAAGRGGSGEFVVSPSKRGRLKWLTVTPRDGHKGRESEFSRSCAMPCLENVREWWPLK